MAIVVNEGEIYAGNAIRIERPAAPHRPLAPV
jgi:hypothetical protein